MSYEIITDSASNLTDDLLERYGIHMVAYHYTVDGVEYSCYQKGEDDVAEGKKFYERIRNGAMTKTSMISPGILMEVFASFLQQGKDLIFVCMSSGLTGTYQSAMNAVSMLREEYPERKCYIIDSLAASLGEGLMVCRMAELRNQGKSIEEAVSFLEAAKEKIRQVFTVDDLKYLKQGGRISAATAFIGGVLNIKPLLKGSEEGTIVPYGRVRGRQKSLDALAEDLAANATNPEEQVIGIAHCDCEEDANYLAKQIRRLKSVKDIIIRYYDRCTGGHVGPGAIALFFQAEGR